MTRFQAVCKAAEDAGILTQSAPDGSVPLSELGMDSLDAVELMMAVEEEIEGVDLTHFDFESTTTLNSIADEVARQLDQK